MINVIAGIVTYNPDIERLYENIKAINNQVDYIIVVDNGSTNIKTVKKRVYNFKNLTLITLYANYGIAYALNMIFKYALNNDIKYVLTLDQDSVCPELFVLTLIKYMINKVGIVCPLIYDINREFNIVTEDNAKEIDTCITSGSLTLVTCWSEVGGFDETMFIDGVDFDFCIRIKKIGWRIVQVGSTILRHELGHTTIKHFLWFPIVVRNHSAFRKYYIAKNIVYLDRKNGSVDFPIKTFARIIKQLVLIALYEDCKLNKLKNILKGTIDGVKEEINS